MHLTDLDKEAGRARRGLPDLALPCHLYVEFQHLQNLFGLVREGTEILRPLLEFLEEGRERREVKIK